MVCSADQLPWFLSKHGVEIRARRFEEELLRRGWRVWNESLTNGKWYVRLESVERPRRALVAKAETADRDLALMRALEMVIKPVGTEYARADLSGQLEDLAVDLVLVLEEEPRPEKRGALL